MSRALVTLVFLVLSAAILLVAIFTFGPLLDAALLPPIRITAVDTATVPGPTSTTFLFRFSLTGHKSRPCRLENYGVGWRINQAIAPVGLFQADGLTPQQIPATIQAGEDFGLGPYYVPIISAARAAPHAALDITFYYRCQFLWLTEHDLSVPYSPQKAAAAL